MKNASIRTAKPFILLMLLTAGVIQAVGSQTPGPGSTTPASPGAVVSSGTGSGVSADLPVKRVVLYSAGIGYYEHEGSVKGDVSIPLSFEAEALDDALKSLLVRNGDGTAGAPSVDFPSKENLDRALGSFRIDLSGDPGLPDILARMRGAEVTVDAPDTLTGRIVGVEWRSGDKPDTSSPWLMILGSSGLRSLPVASIAALRFSDPAIASDFERALSLILSARDTGRKTIEVRLPGTDRRQAAIGYVVPSSIWKLSYRLDLGAANPWFQGWAIVDNDTGQDWKNVSLSLVSGKPVTFIQDLSTPLYVERPIIPLAIAGAARPRSYESGSVSMQDDTENEPEAPGEGMAMDVNVDYGLNAKSGSASAMPAMGSFSRAVASPPAPAPSGSAFAAGMNTPIAQSRGRQAGDQFEFTIKTPVSVERRRSAMIPLVEGSFEAKRVSIYNPLSVEGDSGGTVSLGARIRNTGAAPLPAGPIAVYDGGVFAGDALLDYLPEAETRLIAFGEDLALSVTSGQSVKREITSVKASGGVMTLSRRTIQTTSYTLKNAGIRKKLLVLEHPVLAGSTLTSGTKPVERTQELYRFDIEIAPSSSVDFSVDEEVPGQERIVLAGIGIDALLAYSSSRDIPESARKKLAEAAVLRRAIDDAKRRQSELQTRKNELTSDQDRIRRNLEAAGRDTEQGKQYLKKLSDAEKSIETTSSQIEAAKTQVQQAQSAYDKYLVALVL